MLLSFVSDQSLIDTKRFHNGHVSLFMPSFNRIYLPDSMLSTVIIIIIVFVVAVIIIIFVQIPLRSTSPFIPSRLINRVQSGVQERQCNRSEPLLQYFLPFT